MAKHITNIYQKELNLTNLTYKEGASSLAYYIKRGLGARRGGA